MTFAIAIALIALLHNVIIQFFRVLPGFVALVINSIREAFDDSPKETGQPRPR